MTTITHSGSTVTDTNAPPPTDRLLRLPEVVRIVGLKRSSIYLGVSEGTFPAPVKLTSRAVAWSELAVHAWVSRRVAGHIQPEPPQNESSRSVASKLSSKRKPACPACCTSSERP